MTDLRLVDQLAELREEGHSWPQIAERVGLKQDVVRGIYRRHVKGEKKHPAATPAPVVEAPKGWEAGINLENGRTGTITLPGRIGKVELRDFEQRLLELGFDPKDFEIVEPFQVRSWDALRRNGDITEVVTLWYYRASVIRRRTEDAKIDAGELIRFVRENAAPAATPPPPGEGCAFVFAPSDLQLGKPDGDGTRGTVERFRRGLSGAIERFYELQAAGRYINTVLIASMGDLVENTQGQYAMQTYGAELNRRDQKKLATELLWRAIEEFDGMARLVVAGVGGNHGENRVGGKAHTDFGDNDDLAVLDQLQMVADATGRQVEFVIPRQDLEVTLELHDTVIGLAHGHQMDRGGSTPEQKVQNWWKNQMLGRNPIGRADIIITGHLHHLIVKELNGRWWLQAPSLESRSDWVRHTMGAPGCPGILTFTASDHRWRDLQVL